jgi:cell division inhibitor SepF
VPTSAGGHDPLLHPLTTLEVVVFGDLKAVGDAYLAGHPVVVVVADQAEVRRAVDFASGLAYGTDGTLEKLGSGRYLLRPHGRELTPVERAALDGD